MSVEAMSVVIILKVPMHCVGCARKIKILVKKYTGVAAVITDMASEKVTVVGNVDPVELRDWVASKTRKPVDLISPASGSKPAPKEAQPKTVEKTKEIPVSTVVLKIGSHCEDCVRMIKQKISKIEGVDQVSVDAENSLVTVKGKVDVGMLPTYLKNKLKRSVEIESQRKEGGGGEKKEKVDDGGGGGDPKKGEKREKVDEGGGDQKNEKVEGGGEKKKKEKASEKKETIVNEAFDHEKKEKMEEKKGKGESINIIGDKKKEKVEEKIKKNGGDVGGGAAGNKDDQKKEKVEEKIKKNGGAAENKDDQKKEKVEEKIKKNGGDVGGGAAENKDDKKKEKVEEKIKKNGGDVVGGAAENKETKNGDKKKKGYEDDESDEKGKKEKQGDKKEKNDGGEKNKAEKGGEEKSGVDKKKVKSGDGILDDKEKLAREGGQKNETKGVEKKDIAGQKNETKGVEKKDNINNGAKENKVETVSGVAENKNMIQYYYNEPRMEVHYEQTFIEDPYEYYHIKMAPAPQMFSDENPNACSVM